MTTAMDKFTDNRARAVKDRHPVPGPEVQGRGRRLGGHDVVSPQQRQAPHRGTAPFVRRQEGASGQVPAGRCIHQSFCNVTSA